MMVIWLIKVGIPRLAINRHIVVGVYDLFEKLLKFDSRQIQFIEVENLSEKELDYFLSFGYGIDPKSVKERISGVKYISIWDDLHYHTEESRASRMQYFSTADILLLTYQRAFIKIEEYGSFHSKSRWFPWWVPNELVDESREVEFERREKRILLTGRISPSYPLRQHVHSMVDSIEGLAIHGHPGYGMRYESNEFDFSEIHESYISSLRSFQCSLQIGAKKPLDEYQLAKYFEIPACGAVLVATKSPYLEELGFVSDLNFIEIGEDEIMESLPSLVERILVRDDLERVSKEGFDLIASKHTTKNRVEEIIDVILSDYYGDRGTYDEDLYFHYKEDAL